MWITFRNSPITFFLRSRLFVFFFFEDWNCIWNISGNALLLRCYDFLSIKIILRIFAVNFNDLTFEIERPKFKEFFVNICLFSNMLLKLFIPSGSPHPKIDQISGYCNLYPSSSNMRVGTDRAGDHGYMGFKRL